MGTAQKYEFLIASPLQVSNERLAINQYYHADEAEVVTHLLNSLELSDAATLRIDAAACDLITRVRARRNEQGVLEAFMQEYDLSSEEGVVLMCLAEALLRVPDDETAEKLIEDKLSRVDWEAHLGLSDSILVNAGTWGLMLTGKLVQLGRKTQNSISNTIGKLVSRSGEPMVRGAIRQSMKIMGFQFVMGRNIEEALKRAEKKKNQVFRYSYDILGEAALTAADAERYFQAYQLAIESIGKRNKSDSIFAAPVFQ